MVSQSTSIEFSSEQGARIGDRYSEIAETDVADPSARQNWSASARENRPG